MILRHFFAGSIPVSRSSSRCGGISAAAFFAITLKEPDAICVRLFVYPAAARRARCASSLENTKQTSPI